MAITGAATVGLAIKLCGTGTGTALAVAAADHLPADSAAHSAASDPALGLLPIHETVDSVMEIANNFMSELYNGRFVKAFVSSGLHGGVPDVDIPGVTDGSIAAIAMDPESNSSAIAVAMREHSYATPGIPDAPNFPHSPHVVLPSDLPPVDSVESVSTQRSNIFDDFQRNVGDLLDDFWSSTEQGVPEGAGLPVCEPIFDTADAHAMHPIASGEAIGAASGLESAASTAGYGLFEPPADEGATTLGLYYNDADDANMVWRAVWYSFGFLALTRMAASGFETYSQWRTDERQRRADHTVETQRLEREVDAATDSQTEASDPD